jgi:diguanylate cyclase (GGDEF)-like protein
VDVDRGKLHITVSAGVSTFPEDARERESLITLADKALYSAKRNGRDLVVVFSEDQTNKG